MASSSEDFDPTAKYWVHRWEFRPMPLEIAVLTSVVSAFVGIFGALANGLVMFLIAQIKRFHQLDNLDILVICLCFSDFLSSVVVQPVLITRILLRARVSSLHSYFVHISTHATLVMGSLSLLFIAFCRYFSIRFPFHYANHITETKIYYCATAIITATAGMIIWIILNGQSESDTFPVIISAIFCIIIILQIMIFLIVYAQNRNTRRQVVAVQHNQSDTSQMTRLTNAQRSKTNRTILFMCVVFISTWLPSIIFRIFYVFHGNFTFYIQWLHIFNVIIQLHSCINPWLYVLRTSRIKQVLIRTFRRH